MASPLHLPCPPSHPGVRVALTTGGTDITHLYTLNPRSGLTLSSPTPSPSSSSYTCHFTLGERVESLEFRVRAQAPRVIPAPLRVTVHTSSTTVAAMEEVVLDYKVEVEEEVEGVWEGPALPFRELHPMDPTVRITHRSLPNS